MTKMFCCLPGCEEEPSWSIQFSDHFEDVSESCTAHVGTLIEMGPAVPELHRGVFTVWVLPEEGK